MNEKPMRRTTVRNRNQGYGRIEMDLIRKIAWSFHNTTGLPFEDLLQEAAYAWWAWAEGRAPMHPKYDPRKCAFTSFAYMCVSSHLRTLTSRELRQIKTSPMPEYDLPTDEVNQEDRYEFLESLRTTSEEVQFIIRLVLGSPAEFLSLNNPRDIQREIVKRLMEQYDLSDIEARVYLRQLQAFLNGGTGEVSASA